MTDNTDPPKPIVLLITAERAQWAQRHAAHRAMIDPSDPVAPWIQDVISDMTVLRAEVMRLRSILEGKRP